jgi:hypothetical protein
MRRRIRRIFAVLQYGLGEKANTAIATGNYFSGADICIFEGTMTALESNTVYYYSADGSQTYSYTNQPVRSGGTVYAVLADLGMVMTAHYRIPSTS